VWGPEIAEAYDAMNVTTQDEQIAGFENASRHLCPGGWFVLGSQSLNCR